MISPGALGHNKFLVLMYRTATKLVDRLSVLATGVQ